MVRTGNGDVYRPFVPQAGCHACHRCQGQLLREAIPQFLNRCAGEPIQVGAIVIDTVACDLEIRAHLPPSRLPKKRNFLRCEEEELSKLR